MPDDSPKLRMEHRDAIEAYIGSNGDICLKQEDALGGEDSIITLDTSQVAMVIKWLERLSDDAIEHVLDNDNL